MRKATLHLLVLMTGLITAAATVAARAADESAAIDAVALIRVAGAEGKSAVRIPPGVQRIAPAPRAGVHAVLENLHDLEIDATGATWVLTDPSKAGIIFKNCRNVTLRGLTVDYDPLPFTQGVIAAVNEAEAYYDVRLDAGYPTDIAYFTGRLAAYTFTPDTRGWKNLSLSVYPKSVSVPEPGVLRITCSSPDIVRRNTAVVGDRMALVRRAGGALRCLDCEQITVCEVTVHAAPGIGIQEAGGAGKSRFSYRVTPGAPPAGASAPRLISTCADAFHSAGVQHGPLVEGCLFERMGDDGVAIHGAYGIVMGAEEPATLIAAPIHSLPLAAGDRVRVLDGREFLLKGTAKVEAIEDLGEASAERQATAEEVWKRFGIRDHGKHQYRLKLATPIAGAAAGDLFISFDRVGSGAVVRQNTIRDHRARAILLKCCDALIEDNEIADATFAGIALGPELSTWFEGSYAQNVVVRGNRIVRVGTAAEAFRGETNLLGAGIVVHASTADHRFAPARENRSIVIENNHIESPTSVGLLISSAEDVQVRGNTIIAPARPADSRLGRAYGVNAQALIFVAQSAGVEFADNRIECPPADAASAVVIGPDTERITGVEQGIRVMTESAGADHSPTGANR